MTFRSKLVAPVLVFVLALMGGPASAQDAAWPDLSSPPKLGGGEKDAAVVVGAEKYAFVEHVPGARQNAEDWQAYLTEGLKVPFDHVHLLRDGDAALESMREAARSAASEVKEGGTLWFVFIGHGAPSKDGKDGLLVGIDAQQMANSLFARSLSRTDLLNVLSKGAQSKTVVLIDACFSGKTPSGRDLAPGLQPLANVMSKPTGIDDRTILLTAARSDQFAGPLPKAGKMRPAFSYLALGALRGWAAGENGKVTAGDLIQFADRALKLAHDRTQTPELAAGSAAAVLGQGREPRPDLGKIDRIEDRPAAAPAIPTEPRETETSAAPATEPVLDAETLAARRKAAEEARQRRIAARSGVTPLDLDALREAAADYRQRAALLRRSVGIRERSISESESRAAQIVAAAQADAARQQQEALEAQQRAQSNQQTAQIFGTLLGAFGGSLGSNLGKAIQAGSRIANQAAQNQAAGANAGVGAAGAAGSQEVYQAQREAAPLRDQANKLEGDKKRLALKADQYERLADAKDLLIAAETLRLQSEDEAVAAESADKTIASAKALVERMDIW